MPIFIVETAATSPIREYWKVEAATAEEAAETYGDKGECLYDEALGEEEGRQVSEVHPYSALAGFFAAEAARKEAPAMLAALRKAADALEGDIFTDAEECGASVANARAVHGELRAILARIDGTPTAQPAGAIGEAGGGIRGLLFDIRDFLAGFEDCEDNGELVRGLQERIARATEGEA